MAAQTSLPTEAGRFTAWFSAIERRALERLAREQDSTVNYVVRVAVRQYIGKNRLLAAARELDPANQPHV